MLGNWHVRCGAGEKPEITSNAYLLLTIGCLPRDVGIFTHHRPIARNYARRRLHVKGGTQLKFQAILRNREIKTKGL